VWCGGGALKGVLTREKVSIRAYLPVWVFLYILQFLLMPLIAQDYSFASNFFGNTLYLIALAYYFVITFLGYNGKLNIPSRGSSCGYTI